MTSVARRYGGASAPFERPATADDPSLGAPVVLMVSGGADSMCLLHLLCSLGKTGGFLVSAAHYNHHLRGAESGRDAAFVIRKGALAYDGAVKYGNSHTINREEAIRHIVEASGEDPVVSTTGKASRELFEIREERGQGHRYDFLTVGSMGHSSSIALGIALQRPEQRIWCIDGDGALLMHMGALAVLGNIKPQNLIHVVINNGAHETVGGMPTAGGGIDLPAAARACGYPHAVRVRTCKELDRELKEAKGRRQLSLIEVKCSIGSRGDLGRPTTTAAENKRRFMEYLKR